MSWVYCTNIFYKSIQLQIPYLHYRRFSFAFQQWLLKILSPRILYYRILTSLRLTPLMLTMLELAFVLCCSSSYDLLFLTVAVLIHRIQIFQIALDYDWIIVVVFCIFPSGLCFISASVLYYCSYDPMSILLMLLFSFVYKRFWWLFLMELFQEAELEQLEKNVEASWPKLVEPLEKIIDRLSVVWGIIHHLKAVKDTPELRAAIEEVQVHYILLLLPSFVFCSWLVWFKLMYFGVKLFTYCCISLFDCHQTFSSMLKWYSLEPVWLNLLFWTSRFYGFIFLVFLTILSSTARESEVPA